VIIVALAIVSYPPFPLPALAPPLFPFRLPFPLPRPAPPLPVEVVPGVDGVVAEVEVVDDAVVVVVGDVVVVGLVLVVGVVVVVGEVVVVGVVVVAWVGLQSRLASCPIAETP
jgi:hypothetical protein